MAKVIIDTVDAPGNFHFEDCALQRPLSLGPWEKTKQYYQRLEDKRIGRGCSMCGLGRRFSIVQCQCGSHQHVQIDLTKFKGEKMELAPRNAQGYLIRQDGTVDRSQPPVAIRPTPSFTPIPEHAKDFAFNDVEDTQQAFGQLPALEGPEPGIPAAIIPESPITDGELLAQNAAMQSHISRSDEHIAKLEAELAAMRAGTPSLPDNSNLLPEKEPAPSQAGSVKEEPVKEEATSKKKK